MKTFLPEGEALVAVVDKNGTIVAKKNAATISHQGLIDQKLKGTLPEGARAVTIIKEGGIVHVVDSKGIHGRALPSPQNVTDAVREQID